MPIWLADVQDKPFARKLWFRGLDGGSELDGGDGSLHSDDDWARGVRTNVGEAAQKNFEVQAIPDTQKTAEEKNLNLEQILSLGKKYIPEEFREAYEKELKRLYQ